MIAVDVRREADLAAETVWEEMRHFDRVLNWIPGGAESTISVSGQGVGAVRDLHLATQGYVQHRLIAFDDDQRSFSYELTAGMPIGMQRYVVVASVSEIDNTRCIIRWAGEMTADGSLDETEVARALEVALGNMVTGTVALLKGEKPEFVMQPNEDWQLRAKERS